MFVFVGSRVRLFVVWPIAYANVCSCVNVWMWVYVDLKRSSQNKKCFQYKQQQQAIIYAFLYGVFGEKNVTQQHSKPACLLVSTINVRTAPANTCVCVRVHVCLFSAAVVLVLLPLLLPYSVFCCASHSFSECYLCLSCSMCNYSTKFVRPLKIVQYNIKRARNRFPIPFNSSSFEFFFSFLFFSFRTLYRYALNYGKFSMECPVTSKCFFYVTGIKSIQFPIENIQIH